MKKLLEHPAVKHFTTVTERYKRCHGPQHAAAITYFSVLTLVPLLMLAGAAAGFTLAVLRPEWFHLLSDGIVDALGSTDLAEKAVDVLRNAIANWYGLAGTALIAAAYSGSNWVENLRIGFCRMLQTDEQEIEKEKASGGSSRNWVETCWCFSVCSPVCCSHQESPSSGCPGLVQQG